MYVCTLQPGPIVLVRCICIRFQSFSCGSSARIQVMASTVLNTLMLFIFLLLCFRVGEHNSGPLGSASTSGLYVWLQVAEISICLLKCLVVTCLCLDAPPVNVRINFTLPCSRFVCVLRRVV